MNFLNDMVWAAFWFMVIFVAAIGWISNFN